jgi:hypothetical protein
MATAASGWRQPSSRLTGSMKTWLSRHRAQPAQAAAAEDWAPGCSSRRLNASNRGFQASPSAAIVSTSRRAQMLSSPGGAAAGPARP